MNVNQQYVPINCSYYDELTALALSRKKCEIVYKQSTGIEARILETITDVFTRGQEEFLRLASGVEIRLDRIISVEGKTLSSACNS